MTSTDQNSSTNDYRHSLGGMTWWYGDSPPATDDTFLNLSKHQVIALLNSIPRLTKKCDSLQKDLTSLRTEYHAYRDDCEKRFNATGQYSRRNSLLFEFLFKVPKKLHGFKFSKYIVRELNKLFPHLRISLRDIDASHILYFADPVEKKSPVVIVKFVSRDLRNFIYHNRHNIAHTGVVISEHLTPTNLQLLEKARASSHTKKVWTEQCKIFAIVDDKKKLITSRSDLTSTRAANPDVTPAVSQAPSAAVEPVVINTSQEKDSSEKVKKVIDDKIKSYSTSPKLHINRNKKNIYKKTFTKSLPSKPKTSPFLNPSSGSMDQPPYASQTNNAILNSYNNFRSNYFPGAASSSTSRPWPSTMQSTASIDNNNYYSDYNYTNGTRQRSRTLADFLPLRWNNNNFHR